MTKAADAFSRPFLQKLKSARELANLLFEGVAPRNIPDGVPAEFDSHLPYMPGDDTRWIDWKIYARSEELFVKYFQVEVEIDVALFFDVSPSVLEGGKAKARYALAAAAALTYLALLTSHPFTLIRYAERTLDLRGPFRHLDSFHLLARHLAASRGGTGTDLRASLQPYLLRNRRPATVAVVTDGFQEEPIAKAFDALRKIGDNRLLLFLLADPAERRPRLRGNIRIDSAEGPETRAVFSNRQFEGQLHRRIDGYFRDMGKRLAGMNAEVIELPVDQPFEDTFLNTLSNHVATTVKSVSA